MMIDAMGVPARYEVYGTEGDQVLLLHGWGPGVITLEAHLAPLAVLLSDAHRVTALEFPAHGRSGNPTGDWAVADYALWVKDIILQLGIAPVTLVAHSFGGRIALWLAANEPQLVSRMVLTGCAGIRRESTPAERRRQNTYRRCRQWLDRAERVRVLQPLAARAEEALVQRYGSADYRALDPALRGTFKKIVSEDLRPLLSCISQPVMLVWGERDDATPLWMGQVMAREIADAALHVMEGRGHYAYLEEPVRFAAIVRALIREDHKRG